METRISYAICRAGGLASAILVAWLTTPGAAGACAPAFPAGSSVTISGEEALIVWDAARGREHFIRRADFRTDAADFGFLVPTPSQPQLGEVGDGVFDRLREQLEPEVVHENSYMPTTCCGLLVCMTMARGGDDARLAAGAPVQVLDQVRVAGMDATVLAATDAEALDAWLGDRGYPSRPALVDWLRPYVGRGFVITAFRYVKGDQTATLGSRAVRMSFDVDVPFYPYREPADHPADAGRLLRLYVVADRRLDASVGASRWDADLELAAPLGDLAAVLSAELPSGAVGDGAWLHSFADHATRRVDADLSLTEAGDDAEVRPEPIVIEGSPIPVPIPVEPAVIVGGIWWIVRRRRRRRG